MQELRKANPCKNILDKANFLKTNEAKSWKFKGSGNAIKVFRFFSLNRFSQQVVSEELLCNTYRDSLTRNSCAAKTSRALNRPKLLYE
jgi:hypothetical protein